MQTCLVGHPTSPEQEGTDLSENRVEELLELRFARAIHCSPRSRLSANAVPAAGRIADAILWICHLRIVQTNRCIDDSIDFKKINQAVIYRLYSN